MDESSDRSLKTCLFDQEDTSGRTLVIDLGVGMTVSPGDLLMLNSGVLARQSPVVSLAATGSVVVETADSPTPPTAVLVGPSQVGTCQNATLDGSSSSSGGGAVLKFVWSSPNSTAASSLADRLDAASAGMGQSSVDIGLDSVAHPEVGPGLYVFTLTVINFLGASASTAIGVYRSSEPAPEVAIDGPSNIKIDSDGLLDIAAAVTSASCTSLTGGATSFTIRWSLFSDNAMTGAPSQARIDSWQGRAQPRKLSIPANGLRGGYRYTFKVTASTVPRVSGATSYSNFAIVVVTVAQPALVASIAGGDRTIGFQDVLTLDGSPSYDPDQAGGACEDCSFRWECSVVPTSECSDFACLYNATSNRWYDHSPCMLASREEVSSTERSTIKIPSGFNPGTLDFLKHGLKYAFILVVKHGQREASSIVRITVEEGSPPTVSLSARVAKPKSTPLVANPSDKNTITGIVSSRTGAAVSSMQLVWSCAELCAGADGNCADNPDDSKYFLTPTTGSLSLVIRPGVLAAGVRYTFTLGARESMSDGSIGVAGTSSLDIRSNRQPQDGSLECNDDPCMGTALTTTFGFRAVGWVDADLPLSYAFYANDNVNGEEETDSDVAIDYNDASRFRLLRESGHSNSLSTQLGVGWKSRGYTVSLSVSVTDSIGASGKFTLGDPFGGATVRPLKAAQVAGAVQDAIENDIAKALLEGSGDDALMRVILSAGALNKQKMSGEGETGEEEAGEEAALAEVRVKSKLRTQLLNSTLKARESMELTVGAVEVHAKSVQVMTEVSSEVGSALQESVLDLVASMAGEMMQLSTDAASSTSLSSQSSSAGTKLLAEGLSNLLGAGLLLNPSPAPVTRLLLASNGPAASAKVISTATTAGNDAAVSRQRLTMVTETLGKLSVGQLAGVSAGEAPIELLTANIQLTSQKEWSWNLDNKSVLLPVYDAAEEERPQFTLPTGFSSALAPTAGGDDEGGSFQVELQGMRWESNPYASFGSAPSLCMSSTHRMGQRRQRRRRLTECIHTNSSKLALTDDQLASTIVSSVSSLVVRSSSATSGSQEIRVSGLGTPIIIGLPVDAAALQIGGSEEAFDPTATSPASSPSSDIDAWNSTRTIECGRDDDGVVQTLEGCAEYSSEGEYVGDVNFTCSVSCWHSGGLFQGGFSFSRGRYSSESEEQCSGIGVWNVSCGERSSKLALDCVFWDSAMDGEGGMAGGWSSEGCTVGTPTHSAGKYTANCHCSHLTDFSARFRRVYTHSSSVITSDLTNAIRDSLLVLFMLVGAYGLFVSSHVVATHYDHEVVRKHLSNVERLVIRGVGSNEAGSVFFSFIQQGLISGKEVKEGLEELVHQDEMMLVECLSERGSVGIFEDIDVGGMPRPSDDSPTRLSTGLKLDGNSDKQDIDQYIVGLAQRVVHGKQALEFVQEYKAGVRRSLSALQQDDGDTSAVPSAASTASGSSYGGADGDGSGTVGSANPLSLPRQHSSLAITVDADTPALPPLCLTPLAKADGSRFTFSVTPAAQGEGDLVIHTGLLSPGLSSPRVSPAQHTALRMQYRAERQHKLKTKMQVLRQLRRMRDDDGADEKGANSGEAVGAAEHAFLSSLAPVSPKGSSLAGFEHMDSGAGDGVRASDLGDDWISVKGMRDKIEKVPDKMEEKTAKKRELSPRLTGSLVRARAAAIENRVSQSPPPTPDKSRKLIAGGGGPTSADEVILRIRDEKQELGQQGEQVSRSKRLGDWRAERAGSFDFEAMKRTDARVTLSERVAVHNVVMRAKAKQQVQQDQQHQAQAGAAPVQKRRVRFKDMVNVVQHRNRQAAASQGTLFPAPPTIPAAMTAVDYSPTHASYQITDLDASLASPVQLGDTEETTPKGFGVEEHTFVFEKTQPKQPLGMRIGLPHVHHNRDYVQVLALLPPKDEAGTLLASKCRAEIAGVQVHDRLITINGKKCVPDTAVHDMALADYPLKLVFLRSLRQFTHSMSSEGGKQEAEMELVRIREGRVAIDALLDEQLGRNSTNWAGSREHPDSTGAARVSEQQQRAKMVRIISRAASGNWGDEDGTNEGEPGEEKEEQQEQQEQQQGQQEQQDMRSGSRSSSGGGPVKVLSDTDRSWRSSRTSLRMSALTVHTLHRHLETELAREVKVLIV
jgi:hypothetical protein